MASINLFSRVFVKLTLFLSFLLLVIVFQLRQNIRKDFVDLIENFKINLGNIERELFPERRQPFSLVRQETELKTLLPEPFLNFGLKDWEEFWDLIYGVSGYDVPDNPRLPSIKRQLTTPEIEEKLESRYPIFKLFSGQHWEEFWNIISRKRRFPKSKI